MTEEKKEVVVHGAFHSIYEKAAVWLAMNKSLFTQLMYALSNEVSSGKIPTACTTGRSRMFDKEFMDKQNPKQQAFIMAHEICHEMLMHLSRVERRDMRMWNFACDIKNNNLLLESNFEKPVGGVFDYRGETFKGKSEEFIYDFIEEQEEKKPGGIPENYVGDMDDSTPMTDDEIAQTKGKVQAAIDLHGQGSMSAEMQGMVNSLLHPKEQWHEWLRKYFVSKRYSGCDWTSMCRREFARSGMVSPPFQSDSLGIVVISVDQSGSIGQEMLDHFGGHINSILQECRPERIIVQYFDTQVHDTDDFTVNDLPVELRRVCGGGTCFVDPCAKAEEYEATVHIILTDMMGSMPEGANIPTIWASTSEIDTAPFGDVVKVEMD